MTELEELRKQAKELHDATFAEEPEVAKTIGPEAASWYASGIRDVLRELFPGIDVE